MRLHGVPQFQPRHARPYRARDDRPGTDLHGQAEAKFRGGKVTSLRLGPLPPNP
jgi:hypothetical protein